MKTILALLLTVVALRAGAHDTNDAAVSITMACKKELRSICKPAHGVSPLKCLAEHKADASPDCRKSLDSLKGATVPTKGASAGHASSCVPEFEKACKGVKSKELGACLKTQRTELSEFCRKIADSMDKTPARR